jgi:toxin ParE1/3/4
MPRRLLLSPRAAADLEEIAEYIARDNPVRAATFVTELEETCRAAARMPELHPACDDLARGLRMTVHGRYLILYRDLPDENVVRVECVLHGAQPAAPPLAGCGKRQVQHHSQRT